MSRFPLKLFGLRDELQGEGDVQKDLKEPNLKDRPGAVPRGDHMTVLITVSPWWKRGKTQRREML